MLKCKYCGKENEDSSQICPGCGSASATGPEGATPPPTTDKEWLWMEGCIQLLFSLAPFGLGGHPHASGITEGIRKLQTDPEAGRERKPDPTALLELASRLETCGFIQAIQVYRRVIEEYPGTRQAKEAQRNIKTLLSAHPKAGG